MKAGDIVRITRQPPNHWVPLKNKVGYITVLEDDTAEVSTMEAGKGVTGSGWIPLDCLVPESGEKWKKCKEQVYARMDALAQRWREAKNRRELLVSSLAIKHRITKEAVEDIFQEMTRAAEEEHYR